MRASSNAARLPLVTKSPSAVLLRVTSPNRNEVHAYETYRAYCDLLDSTPLAFDAWRVHSRRLFQNSLSSALRAAGSESVAI
jgi:hypothetical protein